MATYNDSGILMVSYEDLPDEDKDVISKAIEEFQNKCLLSYTKTHDNKVVQKYPLPRVLIHGRQIQMKLMIGISFKMLSTNMFMMLC